MIPGSGRFPWRMDRLPTPVFLGFPCGSAGKASACNSGDLGFISGLGRSPGEGKGLPTPGFWPGEFHGPYSPWGHKELDMTEQHSFSLFIHLSIKIISYNEIKLLHPNENFIYFYDLFLS